MGGSEERLYGASAPKIPPIFMPMILATFNDSLLYGSNGQLSKVKT